MTSNPDIDKNNTNGQFLLTIPRDKFLEAYYLEIPDEHIESKNGFDYLSWSFARKYLADKFPNIQVQFEESSLGNIVFGHMELVNLTDELRQLLGTRPPKNGQEPPKLLVKGGYYLLPYLTDGVSRTPAMYFAVRDYRHNTIPYPTATDIETSYQRAVVKCISTFTGLGLRLYSRESLAGRVQILETFQTLYKSSGGVPLPFDLDKHYEYTDDELIALGREYKATIKSTTSKEEAQ